jgi:hypothetical protein
MDDMRRGLDIEKAEAAFERAAHKALHGTREERSGRFVPKHKPGQPAAGPSSSRREKIKRK